MEGGGGAKWKLKWNLNVVERAKCCHNLTQSTIAIEIEIEIAIEMNSKITKNWWQLIPNWQNEEAGCIKKQNEKQNWHENVNRWEWAWKDWEEKVTLTGKPCTHFECYHP